MRVPLQEWINAQNVSEEMFWKSAWRQQVMFVRDVLTGLVGWGVDHEDRKKMTHVISDHTSKSIRLPVYQIQRPFFTPGRELTLVLRENFYNWKLSVISDEPILADFSGLFFTTPPVEPEYTGNPLSSCYFEGFPEELVFKYYEETDKTRWSAEINGDEALWATVFLILRSLGIVKPREWITRASHQAHFARERARDTHRVWMERIEKRTAVITAPEITARDYSGEARKARRPGQPGIAVGHSDSHGLSIEVLHSDGSRAWYDPDELQVVGALR